MQLSDIAELLEALQKMSSVIDKTFNQLCQYATIDDIEQMGILTDIQDSARILSKFE